MNILFISNNTSLYGANRSMLDIIQNLNPLKYKAYVLIPTGGGSIHEELRKLEISYQDICMHSSVHDKGALGEIFNVRRLLDNALAIKTIINYINMWHIDIVHTNTSVINLGAIASRLTGRKHIWHIRELEIQYNYRHDSKWLDTLLMKQSQKVICISKYVRSNLINSYHRSNAIVVYNPIDEGRYRIERSAYFDKDTVNILCCGIICENKGQFTVVKALGELRKRGYDNVRLTMVGGGIRAEYGKKILRYIRENNMQDYVRIYSFCNDLTEYRKNADIAVMSSMYEALGRVTIESMFSELSLIGSASGATEELIREGYNGLKYHPDSEYELADKIEYIMNHKEEAVRMIKNAKRFAQKYFSAGKQIKKLEKIYEKAMEK